MNTVETGMIAATLTVMSEPLCKRSTDWLRAKTAEYRANGLLTPREAGHAASIAEELRRRYPQHRTPTSQNPNE